MVLFNLLLALFESLSQAGVAGQRTVSQSVNFMAGWSCLLMVQPDRGYGKERGQRGRETGGDTVLSSQRSLS